MRIKKEDKEEDKCMKQNRQVIGQTMMDNTRQDNSS